MIFLHEEAAPEKGFFASKFFFKKKWARHADRVTVRYNMYARVDDALNLARGFGSMRRVTQTKPQFVKGPIVRNIVKRAYVETKLHDVRHYGRKRPKRKFNRTKAYH